MNNTDIIVDDTQTTAGVLEGWHILGYNPSELGVLSREDTETEGFLTKGDFEPALKKVSRKVKK